MGKQFMLSAIRFYQKYLSLSNPTCRYHPTCSEYTYQAVEKHGIIRGLWAGTNRISRCHPWSKGGEDPVK